MLELKKQTRKEIDIDELFQMISGLKDFLDEEVDFGDKICLESLDAVIDLQDDDGSFKLIDSYDIPSDARVDFIYMPTYICSAILMKAYLMDENRFTMKAKSALINGLKASCARNLRGHGYEAFKGQIEALEIFFKAGLREFMDLHSDLCPEFSEMIEKIISIFKDKEANGDFKGPWNESYEEDIKAVNQYFSQRQVFVYGTLMDSEANHGYLENSQCLGKGTVDGYDMYNVGWYPAIVPGNSLIVGELYEVPLKDMPAIDSLEGEGSLYVKKCERVTVNGKKTLAFVYVFLDDVSSLESISAWNKDYVWYVSYGSNMDEERFMCYIEGGSYEGSRPHPACEDTTPPVAVKTIEIPYGMYFGNSSGPWQGMGVSFLDVTKRGKSLGVAYLITRQQFEHVVFEENAGRPQNSVYGWYEDTIDLKPMDGFEVKTITNRDLRDYNEPSAEYWHVLIRGIRQHWCEMSDEEIESYLKSCMR